MRHILQHRQWLLGTLSLFLGLFFVLGYYGWVSWKTSNIIELKVADCDFRFGPCAAKLPSGEAFELQIIPTHMPVLTSVQLRVKIEKIPVNKIYVNFKGAEMNMGEFRYDLSRQKEGHFSTHTILPTCIHDQMLWHAVVHIETPKKSYRAPFLFINQRPAAV